MTDEIRTSGLTITIKAGLTEANGNGKTRSQLIADDVAALLRSRAPLLWVVTQEEARVEQYLQKAAFAAGYRPYTWDCAQGVRDVKGATQDWGSTDPGEVFTAIDARVEAAVDRGCFILRDLPIWLEGLACATVVRQIRNLSRRLPQVAAKASQALIVLTTNPTVPGDLKGHATVIDWPLPDRAEIAKVLDDSLSVLSDDARAKAEPQNGQREAAIQAAIGLTGDEAAACYAKSLVQKKCIDAPTVAQEKKRVIAKEGTIEWFDPLKGGLDAVGGLDNLKAWLIQRRQAYGPRARAYGLPRPKGAFLVGVQGCGKSLSAKAIASTWEWPLLKVDLGALKDKFVGGSEKKLRNALNVIDAVGQCVVWLDEVEKALEGAISGGADGGVSADALGTILTWMQERKGEAFVLATANKIKALPPEFYRKGRFDDTWFVDLPNRTERVAILKASLKANGRESIIPSLDLEVVADKSDAYTGAEVSELIPDALLAGFSDGEREIRTQDLVSAAENVYPLSKTAAEQIADLRKWAVGRAKPANKPEAKAEQALGSARQIEI